MEALGKVIMEVLEENTAWSKRVTDILVLQTGLFEDTISNVKFAVARSQCINKRYKIFVVKLQS